MKFVKVLSHDLRPPIQGGESYEIGVWHHCQNFDTSNAECAPGFYVIPVSELIYYHKPWMGTKVLPAKVKGQSKIFSPAKQRYEYIKLDNPLTDEEIKTICREIEPELGYKLSEALYPVNPLLLPKTIVTDADIVLLRQWSSVLNSIRNSVDSSVRYSVGNSVWNSVWDSIWYNVMDRVVYSVWSPVWNSVMNSTYAYFGSLFTNISQWKHIDHEPGAYPFQAAVDLWYRGLLPVFDGDKLLLLSGNESEVVWEEPKAGWLKAQEEE